MVYALDINAGNFAPATIANFASILNVILPLLILGAALLFLAMLLRGAFTWLTAGDKAESIATAQKTIIFAGLGLALVAFSFLFLKIITFVLGITLPI